MPASGPLDLLEGNNFDLLFTLDSIFYKCLKLAINLLKTIKIQMAFIQWCKWFFSCRDKNDFLFIEKITLKVVVLLPRRKIISVVSNLAILLPIFFFY